MPQVTRCKVNGASMHFKVNKITRLNGAFLMQQFVSLYAFSDGRFKSIQKMHSKENAQWKETIWFKDDFHTGIKENLRREKAKEELENYTQVLWILHDVQKQRM